MILHVNDIELYSFLVVAELERHGRRLVVDASGDADAFAIDCDNVVWCCFLEGLCPMFLNKLVGDVVAVRAGVDEGCSGNVVKFDCFV